MNIDNSNRLTNLDNNIQALLAEQVRTNNLLQQLVEIFTPKTMQVAVGPDNGKAASQEIVKDGSGKTVAIINTNPTVDNKPTKDTGVKITTKRIVSKPQ